MKWANFEPMMTHHLHETNPMIYDSSGQERSYGIYALGKLKATHLGSLGENFSYKAEWCQNFYPRAMTGAICGMSLDWFVQGLHTVYPKKYAHGFVVLCFVVVMQSFIMNSHEVFIHIHQSCFAGTGAIVRLPQCQWSKPDGYGKISQCITTTKHSKAVTVCIFLRIYCTNSHSLCWKCNA